MRYTKSFEIRQIFLLGLLISIGIFIYSNTLNAPFYFDDHYHILNNHHIRITNLDLKTLADAAFQSPAHHRPLPNIIFALNYYFNKYDVAGYHVVNVVIHIITGILLYFFILKTLQISGFGIRDSGFGRSQHSMLAFAAALIWLVHPLHTQSVTYIIQRMNSMAALFYLAAFLCYIQGRLSAKNMSRWLYYSGCVIAAICALGSKQIAVTLPFFIVLYEWYFFQDLSVSWLKRRILPLVGIGVLLVVLVFLFAGFDPIEKMLSGYSSRPFTLAERIMTEWRVVVLYLSLLFHPNPSRLNLDYDFPLSTSLFAPPTTILSLVLIIILILAALLLARRERLVSFCILWFFGNLVLESTIVPLELVYEHRIYLPSMLMPLFVVLIASRLITYRSIKLALFCAVIIVLSFWTYERNALWSDEIRFMRDCVTKAPNKARVHNNLGLSLLSNGGLDEAIAEYRSALKIEPSYAAAHNNLGYALALKGRSSEAILQYQQALDAKPDFTDALYNLGNALMEQGNVMEAIGYYQKALNINPRIAEIHNNLGIALEKIGKYQEAMRHYAAALEIIPDYAKAHNNLGNLLFTLGRTDDSIYHLKAAIKNDPYLARAYNNLGAVMAQKNDPQAAIRYYLEATRLEPDYAEVYYNIGTLLAKMRKHQGAIHYFQKAIDIEPTYLKAHNNLGIVYMANGMVDAAIQSFRKALQGFHFILDDIDRNEEINANKLVIKSEHALQVNDAAVSVINNLGVAYTINGVYNKAINCFTILIYLFPDRYEHTYNLACVYARKGDLTNAMRWLERSFELGFRNWEIVSEDNDFALFRDNETFVEFIQKMKKYYDE